MKYLEQTINQIFQYIKRTLDPNVKVGIIFHSPSFIHGAGVLSYRIFNKLTVNDLWELIYKMTQSRTDFKIAETFNIKICTVEMPQGTGRNKNATINKRKMHSI